MHVTVQIPDELAAQLPAVEDMPRKLLEAYAAQGYRTERFSRRQVGLLLGFDRWETDQFLAHHDAVRPFTMADFRFEHSSH